MPGVEGTVDEVEEVAEVGVPEVEEPGEEVGEEEDPVLLLVEVGDVGEEFF